MLPTDEGAFASMFDLPTDDGKVEGNSDDNPIALPAEISATEFKSLLKVCMPRYVVVEAFLRLCHN
jgi:hypothetical protein